MGARTSERERTDEHAHRWVDDRCGACGLRRYEAWVLDDAGRATMALVWTEPSGLPIRVRPFPVMLGLQPDRRPTQSVAEAFPGIRIGREPKCRTREWTRGR